MHSKVQILNLLYCYRKFDGDRGFKRLRISAHTCNMYISCSISYYGLSAFDYSTSILETFDYIIVIQIYYYRNYYLHRMDKVHGNII